MTTYAPGSPLTFSPDTTGRWAVRFRQRSDGYVWTAPVIGWAVVVACDAQQPEGKWSRATDVEPVILSTDGDERRAETVTAHMLCMKVAWSLVDLNDPTPADIQAQAEERAALLDAGSSP